MKVKDLIKKLQALGEDRELLINGVDGDQYGLTIRYNLKIQSILLGNLDLNEEKRKVVMILEL
tara:strand:- start:2157 stop:2345 length:189 start_codon:yes stop_codon:yes gene_type:complete